MTTEVIVALPHGGRVRVTQEFQYYDTETGSYGWRKQPPCEATTVEAHEIKACGSLYSNKRLLIEELQEAPK